MHLAERGFALVVLTAVLAIAGLWSEELGDTALWTWPAGLLLAGLISEAWLARRTIIRADVETADRALLGREQAAAFSFRNESPRGVTLQYATAAPLSLEAVEEIRTIHAPGGSVGRDNITLLPVRLGTQSWPEIPARLLGRFGLAWWNRSFQPARSVSVAPDTLRVPRPRPTGKTIGMRPRRTVGAGSELHQLRSYVQGDPIARIDWKASARNRKLITREFTEDQHLDVLVAIDAGRLSRVRTGKLDRLGLYANLAARLAEVVTPNDDRVGTGRVLRSHAGGVRAKPRDLGCHAYAPSAREHERARCRIRSGRGGDADPLGPQAPHARDHPHRSRRRCRCRTAGARGAFAVASASRGGGRAFRMSRLRNSAAERRRAGVIHGLHWPHRSTSSARPRNVRG